MKNQKMKSGDLNYLLAAMVISGALLSACSTSATQDTPPNSTPGLNQQNGSGGNVTFTPDPNAKVTVYQASGQYTSPAGQETVNVKLGIDTNNVIETADLSSNSQMMMSQRFQGMFFSAVKPQILGKKISEVGAFDRLNGSSLTSGGFNQAIQNIQAQVAKS